MQRLLAFLPVNAYVECEDRSNGMYVCFLKDLLLLVQKCRYNRMVLGILVKTAALD